LIASTASVAVGEQMKVRAENVTIQFTSPRDSAPFTAVESVSLDVRPGEFVSLIGPSGCGKTTLINAVAGLVDCAAGRVRIDDAIVDRIQDDKVAFMFARDILLPWRTALQNVHLAFEMGRRGPARDSHDRARELLALVGLAGKEDLYPTALSQGMRQRVALARTLAADREILLMDEPFAALDAQTRTVIGAEFSKIWESARKTVILVTHDLTEAIALADRVVVMASSPGRIIGDYPVTLPRPRHVLDLPADPDFQRLHRRLWTELRPGMGGDS